MADENEDLEQGDKGAADDADKGDKGDDLAGVINIGDEDEQQDGDEGDKGKGADDAANDKVKAPDKKATPDPVQQERDELLRKNKELNRALHDARQAKKTDKGVDADGKPVLTDQQLVSIMEQYKDDPATMLNVIAHKAQEAAKQAAKQTVSDVDTERKRKETEDYIYKNYPDLTNADSDLRKHVDKTKVELGVEDHPYGELFGTAVTSMMAMPSLLKNAYEKGKADAESGIADKNRKNDANGKNLSPKGKPGGATDKSTPDTRDVAGRLGLTSPRQIALLNKLTASSKGARTVSVEG